MFEICSDEYDDSQSKCMWYGMSRLGVTMAGGPNGPSMHSFVEFPSLAMMVHSYERLFQYRRRVNHVVSFTRSSFSTKVLTVIEAISSPIP